MNAAVVNLEVVLHALVPCETWGKIIVSIHEHRKRHNLEEDTGHSVAEIRSLLLRKYGVAFKEHVLAEKCVPMLVHMSLLKVGSAKEAQVERYNLTPTGRMWAKSILIGARDGDKRCMKFVNKSTTPNVQVSKAFPYTIPRVGGNTW
jgi:hypothetical protein